MTTTRSAIAGRRDRGYVLIFVAGVLLFISVLVLGMAASLRLDAQLTLREKEQLQSEYVLRGGLQYLLAQLGVSRHAEQMGGALDARVKEELGLWRADGGPYTVALRGGTVLIRLDDAGLLPDANQLTDKEWGRLLVALGASPGPARQLAQRILQEKEAAAKRTGKPGFSTMQEILTIAEIPMEMRYGKGDEAPGLKDLLAVGTDLKQLEVNRSPLILFQALLEANAEQLQKFEAARREQRISLSDAQRHLGNIGSIVYEGQSRLLRAQFSILPESPAASGKAPVGLALVATLGNEGGNFRLIEQRLGAAALLLTAEPRKPPGPPPPAPRRTPPPPA